MSGRRSLRSQAKKHRYEGGDDNAYYQNQHDLAQAVHDMNIGGHHSGTGAWQMGMGQYAHNMDGYQYHHYQSHGGNYHHNGDTQQMKLEGDNEPGPSTGRSLRSRGGDGGRGRKGGAAGAVPSTSSSMVPPASGGSGQTIESEGEDGEDDDLDNSGSKGKKSSGMETTLTTDQMVHNCLYYLLLAQHKKVPVKRSDLIKNAMNSQNKSFPEVMKKLDTALNDVFGMQLVKLEKGKDGGGPVAAAAATLDEEVEREGDTQGRRGRGKGTSSAASYILISKFPSSVCDSVTKRDPEVDSKKTVLFLILTTIFMLNRPIDEEMIWKIIYDMKLNQIVCEKKEDLRKFLKSEFVLPAYLNIELSEQHNVPNGPSHSSSHDHGDREPGDHTVAKYSWGPRAQKEYSKTHMLKFVASRFPGKQPYEFTVQYNILKKEGKVRDLVDDSDAENLEPADGENGSALNIRKRTGGRGETFSIDTGENTETETEGAD